MKGCCVRSKSVVRFASCRSGANAPAFALTAAALAGLVFGVGDFGAMHSVRAQLQSTADAAALAGARELMLAANSDADVSEAAEAFARGAAAELAIDQASLMVEAIVSRNEDRREVSVTMEASPRGGGGLGEKRLTASATASPAGGTSLCIIGLSESQPSSIWMVDRSRISANGCMVYSNSAHSSGFVVESAAQILSASQVCSAGGMRGQDKVNPAPTLDCPAIEDPLEDRAWPDFEDGSCTYTNRSAHNVAGGGTWGPGVYCGGMYLNNSATVQLQPGVYVLRGGTLNVEGNARLFGTNVAIVLTDGARLNVLSSGRISLTAPKEGPMAGILLYVDPEDATASDHVLLSNDARMLVGTVYVPKGRLVIGGANPIADESAWTAILAERLRFRQSAHVVLNTRYGETDIPAPEGLKGEGDMVRLVE